MRTCVCLSLVLLAGQAWALPPPKTEAELMQLADLVVDAECVSIVCDGPVVEDAQKFISTYLSTLWPSASYKGGLPNSLQIRGQEYQWKITPPVGGWHQGAVPKGWVGKLYLQQEADGTYTKVWWNAMEQDQALSKPEPLPVCAGADAGPPDLAPVFDVQPPVLDGAPLADSAPLTDGAPPADMAAGDGGAETTERDGCSCSVGSPPGPAPVALALLLLLGLACRRRR